MRNCFNSFYKPDYKRSKSSTQHIKSRGLCSITKLQQSKRHPHIQSSILYFEHLYLLKRWWSCLRFFFSVLHIKRYSGNDSRVWMLRSIIPSIIFHIPFRTHNPLLRHFSSKYYTLAKFMRLDPRAPLTALPESSKSPREKGDTYFPQITRL